jgi:hypothetical protein
VICFRFQVVECIVFGGNEEEIVEKVEENLVVNEVVNRVVEVIKTGFEWKERI